MAGCQNRSPIWLPQNFTTPIIYGAQEGARILTTARASRLLLWLHLGGLFGAFSGLIPSRSETKIALLSGLVGESAFEVQRDGECLGNCGLFAA